MLTLGFYCCSFRRLLREYVLEIGPISCGDEPLTQALTHVEFWLCSLSLSCSLFLHLVSEKDIFWVLVLVKTCKFSVELFNSFQH